MPDVSGGRQLTAAGELLGRTQDLCPDDPERLHDDELGMLAQAHSEASHAHQPSDQATAQRSPETSSGRRHQPRGRCFGRVGLSLVVPTVRPRFRREAACHHPQQERGVIAPARPGNIDLARTSVAVARQKPLEGGGELAPTLLLGQRRLDVGPRTRLDERRQLGMRAQEVCQVAHREVHLGGDIPRQPPEQRIDIRAYLLGPATSGQAPEQPKGDDSGDEGRQVAADSKEECIHLPRAAADSLRPRAVGRHARCRLARDFLERTVELGGGDGGIADEHPPRYTSHHRPQDSERHSHHAARVGLAGVKLRAAHQRRHARHERLIRTPPQVN